MGMRMCKQCGEYKPLDKDNFRPYYNNRKGFYRVCKSCESINTRYKYLCKKQSPTPAEALELSKISQLYDLLRETGLEPPANKPVDTIATTVDNLLERLTKQKEERVELAAPTSTPDELLHWLNVNLDLVMPNKNHNEVMDHLEATVESLYRKYRPVLHLDDNLKPVHDDTYRDVLNKIQKRIDDYDDSYFED